MKELVALLLIAGMAGCSDDKALLTLGEQPVPDTSVTFSPDGKRMASASWDRTVKVLEVGTGQELLVLEGHTQFVRSVAFSPDGKQLASASADRTVRIWDA